MRSAAAFRPPKANRSAARRHNRAFGDRKSHHFLVGRAAHGPRIVESLDFPVPPEEALLMMTRLIPCVIAAALCAGASIGDEPNKATKEELKLLEGGWRVVAAEMDGKATESKAVVTFAGERCTISVPRSGAPIIETTMKIDPTQTPKWMDVTNDLKKTQKGIYELKGDTLKAVFQIDEKGDRPTEFKTKKGEVMYTYERVKPK
jgi:uncharacterized protein (TIGR03067 family)